MSTVKGQQVILQKWLAFPGSLTLLAI